MSHDIGKTERYTSLALDIIKCLMYDSEAEDEIAVLLSSEDPNDIRVAKAAIKADPDLIRSTIQTLTREGGLIERLKTCIDFDISLFDECNLDYRHEIDKILYFFHVLEHKRYKGVNILELLSKPSMENIDNSEFGMENINGGIIAEIKKSLEAELPTDVLESFNAVMDKVMYDWNSFIQNEGIQMHCEEELFGVEYEAETTITLLNCKSEELMQVVAPSKCKHSPLELLYLKILLHEHIGQIKDKRMVDDILIEENYYVPAKYIIEMQELANVEMDISEVEAYIIERKAFLAKFVYLKEKTSPEENRKLVDARNGRKPIYMQVLNILSYFEDYSKQPSGKENLVNVVTIISCLQSLVRGEGKKDFVYKPYRHQERSTGMQRVEGAPKDGDKDTSMALKSYWVRKVKDRMYANIGMYEARRELRKVEMAVGRLIEDIFASAGTDIDEIEATHERVYSFFRK